MGKKRVMRDLLIVVPPDTRPRANREEKLKALWDTLLLQNYGNADLVQVIHHVPSLARKAWDELLKHKPSNSYLLGCIAWDGSGLISEQAGRKVLTQSPTNMELVTLVRTSSSASDKAMEELALRFKAGTVAGVDIEQIVMFRNGWKPNNKFRQRAARLLLTFRPNVEELVCVMQNCDAVLAKKAWRKFCMEGPSNQELCRVLKEVNHDFIVKWALAMLLKASPANNELVLIISVTKNNRQAGKALAMLLDREPTQDQLRQLIAQAPDAIATQVWPRFLEHLPSEEDLLSIISGYQFVDEAAAEILRRPEPSKKALRTIVEFSNTYSQTAAWLLLDNKPTEEDLRHIAFHVSDLQSEVIKRMPPRSAAEIVEQMRKVEFFE